MEAVRAESALREAGFEPGAARFIALVVLAGGVFVRGMAAAWLNDDDPRRKRTSRFIDRLSPAWGAAFGRDKGVVAHRVGPHVVHHCSGRGLYRAVGAENSRYRRALDPGDLPRLIARLVRVAAALSRPAWPWLFSIEAQLAMADSLGLSRDAVPRRVYGLRQKNEVFFPDRPLMALASDRLVIVHPHADDDLVDNTSSLRTWWRHYAPFVDALSAAGVQVSLRVARAPSTAVDPVVEELLALWEADGAAIESVREIWFVREELRRLEGAHPAVVDAYGGADGAAARQAALADRLAALGSDLGGGAADTGLWTAEGVPESW